MYMKIVTVCFEDYYKSKKHNLRENAEFYNVTTDGT
jgi:hypothetical protein